MTLQNLLKDSNVRNELAYISVNLNFLCDSIKTTRNNKKPLNRYKKNLFNEICFGESKISSLTGSKIETVKINSNLKKNLDLKL